MGATLAADMHCAFLNRQFCVPGREMHDRHFMVAKGTPHHPPAVACAFLYSAIGAGAAEKQARNVEETFAHDAAATSRHCS